MSTVQIRLVGGLGNQLFQYATARALAIRHNASVLLDLSWFGTDPARTYALAPLKLDPSTRLLAAPSSLANSILPRRLLDAARKLIPGGIGQSYTERGFCFDSEVMTLAVPVRLEGYFQSEKYFSGIRSDLTGELQIAAPVPPRAEELLSRIRSCNSICVHIRRGDYVSNAKASAYHGLCDLGYYIRGVQIASASLNSPHCFVFTDDPRWVRSSFQVGLPMTLVDVFRPDEAHEDLRLMANCKRFVIANSSLSWWGAWLSNSPGKVVVAPQRWFKDSENDTRDLLPHDWIRV